jgi:DNA repair photolyase
LYTEKPPEHVNPEKIIKLFKGELPKSEFTPYAKKRITFQWGGLSDPFDMFEKHHRIGLQIMKQLRAIKYPICFSTKGTWWLDDPEYMKLFKDSGKFWNVKFSIINLNSERAKFMERGVPSPQDRLDAIGKLVAMGGSATLRLRPFIIGHTDRNDEYLEVIARAARMGAKAVSTEFLCIESRATAESMERFEAMSELMGIDLLDFYRKNTVSATGYLRLNWKIKKPYVDKMEELCKKLKLRFYVSDAHHKDKCVGGSCCGLSQGWSYHEGQFTAALVEAKTKGEVGWEFMELNLLSCFRDIKVVAAHGLNIARGNPRDRARFRDWTIYDYVKYIWNSPNHPRSPYKYFYGLLKPNRKDDDGNIIYTYHPYV